MLSASSLLPLAQQFGHQTPEFHPSMPIKHCTKALGCKSEQTKATIDSNWRWTHKTGTTDNCYTGNMWNTTYCPGDDSKTCTQNCALDGVDETTWHCTYGIDWDESVGMMNFSFVTQGPYSRNVGGRTYLMEDDDNYKMFKLLDQEFTFTVSAGGLPCGLNGAVYFVEMEKDGGKSSFSTNEAGAKLGTGYCDAQCPHDLKWINGEANMIGWVPSKTDMNAGTGKYGTCCAELDIWEANKISTQMTVHGCKEVTDPSIPGVGTSRQRCEGITCGDNSAHQRFNGTCDKDGCDINPYRVGEHDFYGPGPSFQIDSTKEVTVVTQFPTNPDGTLKEMIRFYVQDGKRIDEPLPSYSAQCTGSNCSSITNEMCDVQKKLFGDVNDFEAKGGIAKMGEAMGRGMALVMSMWDDHDVNMLWLDSTYPVPDPPGSTPKPGAPRGSCDTTSGDPKDIESNEPHSYVVYKDIRYGEIGSTLADPLTPPSPPKAPTQCPHPSTYGTGLAKAKAAQKMLLANAAA